MERVKEFFNKDIVKNIISYIAIIVAVIIIRVFFIDPFRVDGASMNTTLSNGEIMILNKIVYRKKDIQRFDIVVVDIGDKKIIKRVIGLPGETIEYKDNVLYINGEKMKDPYPSTETGDFDIKDYPNGKIPGDSYFVMGDNRANSADSRISKDQNSDFGTFKRSQIKGRAKLVIWPIKKFGIVK